jgi:hypothetical protein
MEQAAIPPAMQGQSKLISPGPALHPQPIEPRSQAATNDAKQYRMIGRAENREKSGNIRREKP